MAYKRGGTRASRMGKQRSRTRMSGRRRRQFQRGSGPGRKYAGHSHGLGMAVSGSSGVGYHGHNVNIDNPLHRGEMSGGMHPHTMTPWAGHTHDLISSHHLHGSGIHQHGWNASSSYAHGHSHGVNTWGDTGEHQHPRMRFPGGHQVRQGGGGMRRQLGGQGGNLPQPWKDHDPDQDSNFVMRKRSNKRRRKGKCPPMCPTKTLL